MKILRELMISPTSAIMRAKRKRNMIDTANMLMFVSFMIALAIGIVVLKLYSTALSGLAAYAAIATAIFIFFLAFLTISFIGFIIKIIAVNLGGKGKYFDGLTAITYSSLAPSLGLLVSTLLLYVPLGLIISAIIVALTTAMGFSTLYRSIKELFKMDMITAFITVSVTTMTLFAAIYTITLMSGITKLTALI